jgi:hypothetical protein
LPIILQTIRVGLESNSIGISVFELTFVNSVDELLFSEAMEFIFKKLALVLPSIRPFEGPLSIIEVMVEFAFV